MPLWAKSSLRSNLRASNLRNFPWEHYAHTRIVHPPDLKCLPLPLGFWSKYWQLKPGGSGLDVWWLLAFHLPVFHLMLTLMCLIFQSEAEYRHATYIIIVMVHLEKFHWPSFGILMSNNRIHPHVKKYNSQNCYSHCLCNYFTFYSCH